MEHATETAVEAVVDAASKCPCLRYSIICLRPCRCWEFSMDTTVKESVELMVELICAFSVMAMLSLAMYTDVISRLLERLF